MEQKQRTIACRDHLQGRCIKGDDCRFSHEKEVMIQHQENRLTKGDLGYDQRAGNRRCRSFEQQGQCNLLAGACGYKHWVPSYPLERPEAHPTAGDFRVRREAALDLPAAFAGCIQSRYLNSGVCTQHSAQSRWWGEWRCRGPTTVVPGLGKIVYGDMCEQCLRVTRDYITHIKDVTGLGQRSDDPPCPRPLEQWVPEGQRGRGSWSHRTPAAPPVEVFSYSPQAPVPLPIQLLDVARIAVRLELSLEKRGLRRGREWWEVGFCPDRRQFFFYFIGNDEYEGRNWRQWDFPADWNHLYNTRIVIHPTSESA